MPNETWKSAERKLAAWLTEELGIRFKRQANTGDHAYDIKSHYFGIESKYRKQIPQWLKDILIQCAGHKSVEGKIPLAVLQEKGKNVKEGIVVMDLEAFTELADMALHELRATR